MDGKPDNVMLKKWLPQQAILAHPKLKLFVTHGGQSSCQEALCHQKPIVAIPVFGDQPSNAFEAEQKGYGKIIPLAEMNSEKLLEAINEILNNSSYELQAKKYGELVMDQMELPLERAIWWIEHVLRYPGENLFKSPVHDLYWFQLYLLDVILFLSFSPLFCFYFVYRFCCKRSNVKSKTD